MYGQNNFWSPNIKFLRNRKNLSQEQLADALGVPCPVLRAYESGRVSLPSLNDLLDLSGYFGVGIDTLLKVNLPVLPERALKALQSGEDLYLTGNRVRSITCGVYEGADDTATVLSGGRRGRLFRFRSFLRKSLPAYLGKKSEQCFPNSPGMAASVFLTC